MRSKRSFFNKKIFTKTMGRFWPIWVIYALIWMTLPITVNSTALDLSVRAIGQAEAMLRVRRQLLETCGFVSVGMTAVFAIFAAMAVWSFMYSSRSANGVAALPVRREGVFCSAFAAGIVPVLAAHALVTLACAAAMREFFDLVTLLQWFNMVSLQYIFFYGFATFCAQLTGNILILPALYIVLNFTVITVESLLNWLGSLFIYGAPPWDVKLGFLSPAYYMVRRHWVENQWAYNSRSNGALESVDFTGWGALCAYALAGIVLVAAALALYRRRRMENAGDVVAINVLKPIFRYCMAFGTALVLCALLYQLMQEGGFFGAYRVNQGAPVWLMTVFMLLGALIGWFIAEMLIKKSFRVFRSGWLGLGICALVIVAGVVSCENDIFGYERWTPRAEKVENVHVYISGQTAELTAPENMEAVIGLHRAIIDYKKTNESLDWRYSDCNYYDTTIVYELTNGRMALRTYNLRLDTGIAGSLELNEKAEAVVNCQEAINSRKAMRLEVSPESMSYINVYGAAYASDCARVSGYDSVEDYILLEHSGLSEDELESMSAGERRARLAETIMYSSLNWQRFDTGEQVKINGTYYSIDPDKVKLDELIFSYNWDFSREEMCELYYDCILPDIADGTLGRVWLMGELDQDYLDSVYCFQIGFEVSERSPAGVDYDPFYTVPTVDSRRTVNWLERRGVRLLTQGEAGTGYWEDALIPASAAVAYK